jgi:hypothetical protein
MIRNFSWVIPHRLAGSALPGEGAPWAARYVLSDLQELRGLGIRRLVSLTDYAGGFGPLCCQAGLEWTYFPIPDFDVPEPSRGFIELVDSLAKDVAGGRAVCVHCYAGIGRTGLVLACVLGRYHHLDGREAIRRVRGVRAALETSEQEHFVRRFLTSPRSSA